MATNLSCACSSVDKGMNWASCSTRVILFRNCHFQSFQRLSGISLKNLYLVVAVLLGGSFFKSQQMLCLLGGSSSRSSEMLRLPGGSSESLLLQLSGQLQQ